MQVRGEIHAPAALLLGKVHGNHMIGGCVGPRALLDHVEKTGSFVPMVIESRFRGLQCLLVKLNKTFSLFNEALTNSHYK